MGFSNSSAKREAHSNTSLPQETRETSNKQEKHRINNLTLHLKQLEKVKRILKLVEGNKS